MKQCTVALTLIVLLVPLRAAFAAANIRPVRLRCEYRENPLGIDSQAPRLSWVVKQVNDGSRGLQQTAYQILVASTPQRLAADQGDLWDSGRIDSDETIQLPYNGIKLRPGQACFWKVRLWDRLGQPSLWSEMATWTMGLFVAADGKAKWIGAVSSDANTKYNPNRLEIPPAELLAKLKALKTDAKLHPQRLPLLRREFDSAKPIRRAIISVCGLGQYELSLNGAKVGDHVLDPGWTDYGKTCLYSTYDVTDMVRSGKNCLGIMLGNGMYHETGKRFWKFIGSYGPPKMILHLRIDYKDGTTAQIVSDEAWRVAQGPITLSSIFGGEDYDARLEQPGWDQPGFDDSDWQAAFISDGPGGRLVAQSAPPIKVIKTFAPLNTSEPKPGVFVYDLGQNFSGRPVVSLRGPSGAAVKITPAEVLDENGLADQRGSGGPSYFTYTLKGDGMETWHPQFSYYGFRYLQVEGAVPENKADGKTPVLLKIEGQFTRNSAERAGSFACSNELMNRIYDLIDWSIGSNLQSILTDCPHREKLGWLEIAHLMGPSIMYNYDAASTYAKIAHDMADAQNPNGLVPTIAPQYVVFSGPFVDSPAWGSAAVIIPWQMYQWYGDRRILDESYGMMKQYVDYLTNCSHDHIVAQGLGDWGDFPSVEKHMGWAQLTPVSLTDTAIYYLDVTLLARAAHVLGKADDAREYAKLAEEIKMAFNRTYFNTERKQYVAGMPIVAHEVRNQFNSDLCNEKTNRYSFGSQASQAIPLALGMVAPENVEAVLVHLVADIGKQEYITAGDVGHRFLLQALAAGERNDLAYKLHNRTTVPGYGWQIKQRLTALAEAWDGRASASLNHCQMGHFMEWFYNQILGIQNADGSLAYKEILIRPQIVSDLRWARGGYDSIRGPINVDWRLEGKLLTLRVTIPVNTSAIVYVPTSDESKVRESGVSPAAVRGIIYLGRDRKAARYKVESGTYVFTSPL